jgi:L-ascorbate metabolism protein UlaG (beta-lactamase superfamily)
MKLLYIGQNTFRITLENGIVLLTDPWFKMNPVWRAVPPALEPDRIGTVHFVLSSHNHLDHIDAPSLALARKQGATVIGSARVARRARRCGIKETVPMASGEQRTFDSFSIKATPAFHPLAKDAIGFLIGAEDKHIYFCGDTRPHSSLVDFLRQAGAVDAAFLQIACARYFGKDDGLNLQTAAELARAFKPRIVVPMHYHGRFKEADPSQMSRLLAGSGIEIFIAEPGREVEFLPLSSPYPQA